MADRKVFRDSVVPLPEPGGVTANGLIVQATKPEHGQEKMTVIFSLAVPSDVRLNLERRVERGEVVSPAELKNSFAADKASADRLRAWLEQQGFQIEKVTPDNTTVYAQATVNQIAQSLNVRMTRVTRDGITYTAAANAPSLPAEVSDNVHAIVGLQPFRQLHKHSRQYWRPAARRAANVARGVNPKGPGAAAAVADAAAAGTPPYQVADILKAYGADGLNVTGKGQTIAILIDTFPADADLVAFWQRNNLPTTMAQIEKVNVTGAQLPVPEGEETLDASWSSGVAPGATIRIYATGSLSFVDLDRALDAIIADSSARPDMRQLSISLGLGETFMGGPDGEVAVQHQKFLRLAASGVNVFVSSGDAGSNPDETGHSSGGPTQAEYESSDPAVIGVGGTSLTFADDGSVSEQAWSASGGGKSVFFNRPAWQTGAGVPDGSERLVPDVSLVADPNTGAFLVLQGQDTQIGGTSWSAPVWAGFCALINEARLSSGKDALPFLNPLIYPLIGSPSFRDIVAGSNGAFNAGPGYDVVTGIGVPNVQQLIAALP